MVEISGVRKEREGKTSESTRPPETPGAPGWERRAMMAFISASSALRLSMRDMVSAFTFVATIVTSRETIFRCSSDIKMNGTRTSPST